MEKLVVKRHLGYSHNASVAMSENFVDVMEGTKYSIVCKLSYSAKETVERNKHILGQIIKVILLLSKQSIALRGHIEEKSNFMAVLNLNAESDPVLDNHLKHGKENAKYTSPGIQNELIGLCDYMKTYVRESFLVAKMLNILQLWPMNAPTVQQRNNYQYAYVFWN